MYVRMLSLFLSLFDDIGIDRFCVGPVCLSVCLRFLSSGFSLFRCTVYVVWTEGMKRRETSRDPSPRRHQGLTTRNMLAHAGPCGADSERRSERKKGVGSARGTAKQRGA